MRTLLVLWGLSVAACSSDAATTDAATTDAGADAAPMGAASPLPVPTLAEGTCEFKVDGKTHKGGGFTSLVTGKPDSWQLQCQAADGTRSLSINMGGNGFSAPGTYTAGSAPQPNGIAAYSEQDSSAPGTISMYRQDKGWTLTLSAVGSSLIGAASFVGALAPNAPKPVTVGFNFKFK